MDTLLKKNVDPFGLFKYLKRKEREREKMLPSQVKNFVFPWEEF